MKQPPSARKEPREKGPLETIKRGSSVVGIYATTNRIFRRNPITGLKELRSEHPQYAVAYHLGTRRIIRKFSDLTRARNEAAEAATRLANGETEILKLDGSARADYVHAVDELHAWRPGAHLTLAIHEYVSAVRRIPDGVSLKEVVDYYLSRHPAGLPPKTIPEVVTELIESKTKSGKSDVYIKDLRLRLGQFAKAFNLRISTVTGKQIEDFLRAPKPVQGRPQETRILSPRTQNNFRMQINTLFKFAKRRGYLPKDHDELSAVELVQGEGAEIEIFTPDELVKLFNACLKPVKARANGRDRQSMIPFLAIAAFCGLRSSEIARLDWSEIRLTGPERFIEVKAAKAKTASRRTVPIPDNCAAWLAPHAQASGPVCPYERADKQAFQYLGPAAGIPWKRNGLRHSFISYRLALIKNVHQVSLEAGNSPQMVFAHYRQLVTETQATAWFKILPPGDESKIHPLRGVGLPESAGEAAGLDQTRSA